ncbi:alpha/beta fold hydrolase [Thalassotalea piscium]|uniref:Pimeloyl-ACP methyl ester carboxylesterase n=1 Tax=Thalassotalea piscium TaxID=1230533 RepID=A0A7X0NHP3_9GAMM|nr:alpha/beta hydrolase [Thalassotalea piscium]MBB6543657.1 pimeloyl-ACP methyl ester carboxylesterase [Thalassotalea piscium]
MIQEEVSFNLGEITLRGMAWGDENDDIILCLHGWLDNAASFLPLAPYLKDKRVIAIDWPGHGFSSHRSQDAHYHFIDYIYDLLALFELNQWQCLDIVGHSMGGMIASAFTAAFPERVNTLTLVDSIGFISATEQETTQQLRQGMLSRLANAAKKKAIHTELSSAVKARVAVSDLSVENAELIVKRGIVKQSDGFVWSSDSRLRMTSPYRLTLAQAKQFISDISRPVLLIYGDKGLDMVSEGITFFGPLFKSIVMKKLPGGHHLHMEGPKRVAEEISAFINQNSCNN